MQECEHTHFFASQSCEEKKRYEIKEEKKFHSKCTHIDDHDDDDDVKICIKMP